MELVKKVEEPERSEILKEATEGITYTPSKKTINFTDTKSLLTVENNALYEAGQLGIINGYEDGSFKPYNNVPRAEVSAIIYRWMNLLKERNIIN